MKHSPRTRSLAALGTAASLGLGLLAPQMARAQLGSAIGASIGHDLTEYRAFQHNDPGHPRPLQPVQSRPRAAFRPGARLLGLVEITVSGPHAGAVRTLPDPALGASPKPPPNRAILLVPAVTAETLGDTPVARTRHAGGAAFSLDEALQVQPLPATAPTAPQAAGAPPTLKIFTRAEQAALPAVPGVKALLPYGFDTHGFIPGRNSPGAGGLHFHRPATITPLDDLDIVFAVIDTTAP